MEFPVKSFDNYANGGRANLIPRSPVWITAGVALASVGVPRFAAFERELTYSSARAQLLISGGFKLKHTHGPGLGCPLFVSLLGAWIGAGPLFAETADANQRRVTKLAEGVYAIQHKSAANGNPSGNTTVIIGDREALVVDSSFLPSAAREDIAQIR
jgi:hypothetical protein